MKAALMIAAASTLLIAGNALAVDNDNGAWGIATMSDRIGRNGTAAPWRYSLQTQYRYFARNTGSQQYLLRGSLGYSIGSGKTLWVGYDYFQTDPDGGSPQFERRYWQQLSWSAGRIGRASVSLRTRFEQRDREVGSDIGLRLRQQVALSAPLQGSGRTVHAGIEPFFNLRSTDWGARSGLDQVRTTLGIRQPLGNRLSVELGYMHQYIDRPSGANQVNHIAMLHLRYTP